MKLKSLMQMLLLIALSTTTAFTTPRDDARTLRVDGRDRTYLVHVPQNHSPEEPLPVVLVLHGAGTNAAIMVPFCGINQTADAAGFMAVYPDGTGVGIFQTFNAGGHPAGDTTSRPDDVRFIAALLDDLARHYHIDTRRIYATGMSNGGMMCYRLAAELSHRIAAIAPVSGTMAISKAAPSRPVPILHFHGTQDRIVPPEGPDARTPAVVDFQSVEATVREWVRVNGCGTAPIVEELTDRVDDGTHVTQTTYSSCRDDSEVILVEIHGGGHTWPGQQPPVSLLGRSTSDISANTMMWEFFRRHRLP